MSTQNRQPDPAALELAGRLQALVVDWPVYLFGSRARGDYRPDSDIDLMLLTPERLSLDEQNALVDKLYPAAASIQLVNLTQAEFAEARHAYGHVAGGAQRDGLTPDGEHLPMVEQNRPWPEIQNRLRLVHLNLLRALLSYPQNHATCLQQAQAALENALKAILALHGRRRSPDDIRYAGTHDLDVLAAGARDLPGMPSLPDAATMKKLTRYHTVHSYDSWHRVPDSTPWLTTVQHLCGTIAVLALDGCGKTSADLRYAELAELYDAGYWPGIDITRPLGGLDEIAPMQFRIQMRIYDLAMDYWPHLDCRPALRAWFADLDAEPALSVQALLDLKMADRRTVPPTISSPTALLKHHPRTPAGNGPSTDMHTRQGRP